MSNANDTILEVFVLFIIWIILTFILSIAALTAYYRYVVCNNAPPYCAMTASEAQIVILISSFVGATIVFTFRLFRGPLKKV